jgi:hypothetical protein
MTRRWNTALFWFLIIAAVTLIELVSSPQNDQDYFSEIIRGAP